MVCTVGAADLLPSGGSGTVEEATVLLDSMAGLEEAILTDLATRRFGYGAALSFVLPMSAACGGNHERRVTIELDGVHHLVFEGGLSQAMIDSPESIDWGLGEVALVRIGHDGTCARVQVLWEGDRRIDVVSQSVMIVEHSPSGAPGE